MMTTTTTMATMTVAMYDVAIPKNENPAAFPEATCGDKDIRPHLCPSTPVTVRLTAPTLPHCVIFLEPHLMILLRRCRSGLRTAGALALLAVVALSRACGVTVSATNPGVAGVLSAAGVNYVLNSLIPVIERMPSMRFHAARVCGVSLAGRG
jgi:hypothetical protein